MRKRLARLAAFIAAATLAFGVAPVPAASAEELASEGQLVGTAVTRLWGADRYATSLAIAEAVADDAGGTLDTVVLVSGRSWTDAVTAAPLAGSLGAPVLLVDPRSRVSADIRDFMSDTGVENIVMIGSEKSVPDAALLGLSDIDDDIERITAASKYPMSVAVAERMGAPGSLDGYGATVILASGEVFADALSAGPLAAKAEIPILLTASGSLPSGVSSWIAKNANHVVIMGGTAAVSQSVEDAVAALGKNITRVGGKDRYETATMFADFAADVFDGDCFDGTVAGVATGGVAADAYSAAPLLARHCAPLTLTHTRRVPEVTKIWLGVEAKERIFVFGGTKAVSETAVAQARLRHWDHQALVDLELWSHCPPESWPTWLDDLIDGFDETWANWDTETTQLSTEFGDFHVASGWWTDRQIDRWLPRSGITGQAARQQARYLPYHGTVAIWPEETAVGTHKQDSPQTLTTLGAAMQHRGNSLSWLEMIRTTRYGIAGSGAWTNQINADKDFVGKLLTGWTRWQYALPPTTHEPIAWPLDTLFRQHESTCVSNALIEMCKSGQTPSPMLAADHPIGRVLRSLACGEKNEEGCFVSGLRDAAACIERNRS